MVNQLSTRVQMLALSAGLLCMAAAAIARAPPLKVPPFPTRFAWSLQLKEWHGAHVDYAQAVYYWDYSTRPFFSSRQENNVKFDAWRFDAAEGRDVPYNVFYAWRGALHVGYVDWTHGTLHSATLGNYTNAYWPQNMLSPGARVCALADGGAVRPLAPHFNNSFNDNALAVRFACTLSAISPSFYVSPKPPHRVLRFELRTAALPNWQPQVWDITQQRSYAHLNASFMQPPSWLML